MPDIDENVEDEGVDEEKLEAAIELGRLVADETGLCSKELGQLIWASYQKLVGENEETE